MAQLEPASPLVKDFFAKLFLSNPSPVFIKSNTNKLKNFKIETFLNKRQVKKKKDQAIKYLVYWKGYNPKWDKWYNVKDFDNTATLVKD